MNLEHELQRRFDAAGDVLELDPGSISGVKQQAARARRRTMVMRSVAAVAVVALGAFALPRVLDDGESPTLVEVDAPAVPGIETGTAPVTEADWTYLGAFNLPNGDIGDSRFDYGAEAAAFNPYGDPASTDGFGGSLFVSTHVRQNVGIAEVSIPAPAPHDGTTDGLPVATVIQAPADITDGRGDEYVGGADVGGQDAYHYGGLEVVDGPDGPRLHWSVWQYQNLSGNDVAGHGHSSLDLANPDPQGPWYLDDYMNFVTAGYLFSVPDEFADELLGGNPLIGGYANQPHATDRSYGPPFFAFDPPAVGEPNERLAATPLGLYVTDEQQLEGWGVVDITSGAAWVTTSDGNDAVVTVGRRALGEQRAIPTEDDCSENRGSHGGPYEPQITFYDPEDLARVASGAMAPSELAPYLRWNPSDELVPTCEWILSSISFDPATNRVYVVQMDADTSRGTYDSMPVVHVFQI